ncbi:unnamed protein product [Closterium sp. NIES-54]
MYVVYKIQLQQRLAPTPPLPTPLPALSLLADSSSLAASSSLPLTHSPLLSLHLRPKVAALRRSLTSLREHRQQHRNRRAGLPIPVLSLVGYTNQPSLPLLPLLLLPASPLQMAALRRSLTSVREHRQQHRDRRAGLPIPVLSLVGYTNAGKSTLLNRLTGAGVLAEDKLFATLDPTTRRTQLPNGKECLLTDTVGFIQKLPTQLVSAQSVEGQSQCSQSSNIKEATNTSNRHHQPSIVLTCLFSVTSLHRSALALSYPHHSKTPPFTMPCPPCLCPNKPMGLCQVAAFRATLEEITEASVLLHVVDVSHPMAAQQVAAVLQVLAELEVSHIPMLTVLNKVDQVSPDWLQQQQRQLEAILDQNLGGRESSAGGRDGGGREGGRHRMVAVSAGLLVSIEAIIPYQEGHLLGLVYQLGAVDSEEHLPEGTLLSAHVPLRVAQLLLPYRWNAEEFKTRDAPVA